MLELYVNTITREWFDEHGDPFRSGMPRVSYLSHDTVKITLCTQTDDAGVVGVDVSSWERDKSFSVDGVNAKLTVDSDYIHKIKGELQSESLTGEVTEVKAEISSASYAKIPPSGVIRLFDAYGNYETLGYTARSISGSSVTFTASGTLTGTYAAGGVIDCTQAPYCSAMMDSSQSKPAEGVFVFDLVVNSVRLREEMDYSDVASLSIKGLEILLYKTVDGEDIPLNSYVCDTFALTGTIGDVGYDAPPPDELKNQMNAAIEKLFSAGLEVQQTEDDEGNVLLKIRPKAGGEWSDDVKINRMVGFAQPTAEVVTAEPESAASAEVTASGEVDSKLFAFKFTIPKGEKGETGPAGPAGAQGEKGADGTMTFEDLTEEQKQGLKGDPGKDAKIASVTVTITPIDDSAQATGTATVTDAEGDGGQNIAFTLSLPKGEKGDKGDPGKDGEASQAVPVLKKPPLMFTCPDSSDALDIEAEYMKINGEDGEATYKPLFKSSEAAASGTDGNGKAKFRGYTGDGWVDRPEKGFGSVFSGQPIMADIEGVTGIDASEFYYIRYRWIATPAEASGTDAAEPASEPAAAETDSSALVSDWYSMVYPCATEAPVGSSPSAALPSMTDISEGSVLIFSGGRYRAATFAELYEKLKAAETAEGTGT